MHFAGGSVVLSPSCHHEIMWRPNSSVDWLEGWTGSGRYITGPFKLMLDANQCWSPKIKLPKFNRIQKTHMATWVSPCHMSFLGWMVEQDMGDTWQDTLDQCSMQINAYLLASDYPVPKLIQNDQERPCQGRPPCQISRSKVKMFGRESVDGQTDGRYQVRYLHSLGSIISICMLSA